MNYRLLRFPGFKKKAFTMNYDDGNVFDEKMIEIMKAHGIKGTFNLNGGLMGNGRRMPIEKVPELYEPNGMEVACHGYRHRHPLSLPKALMLEEYYEDRKTWENLLGHQVHGMAYAFGGVDDTVEQMMKDMDIWFSRTTVSTEKFAIPDNWLRMPATCHHRNPRVMELCDQFLGVQEYPDLPFNRSIQSPSLFLLWGHSYEFNDNDNWELLEQICEKMGGHDDVWYATCGEIYSYVKAYEALEYSLDGKDIHNPTATDIYLQYFGSNNIIVHAGETVHVN